MGVCVYVLVVTWYVVVDGGWAGRGCEDVEYGRWNVKIIRDAPENERCGDMNEQT